MPVEFVLISSLCVSTMVNNVPVMGTGRSIWLMSASVFAPSCQTGDPFPLMKQKHVIMRIVINTIMKIAGTLPDSDRLRCLVHSPKLKTWHRHHSGNHPLFDDRTEMYDFINREVVSDKPMQYLEFGVWKGESIKYFAKIDSHPGSRFVGFDTFTGMPDIWLKFFRKCSLEACDAGGELPQSDDIRVSFVQGLFQDTLSTFLQEYEPTGGLVIHNDCDLYSSTLYVLTRANDIIVPGTVIIFDEFYSLMHEFRALEDYCSSYRRSYEVLAATHDHGQIAIKML